MFTNLKTTLLSLPSIALFALAQPIPEAHASGAMPGGYSAASTNEKEVISAAHFAVSAQQKVINANAQTTPTKLELVKIVKAESQVVAGFNYRLRLKVRINGTEKTADAVVWWQPWRKPNPYQLTSWQTK